METNERDRYPVEMVTKYIATLRKPSQEPDNFQRLLEQQKFREKKRENDLAESLVAPTSVLSAALEKTCAAMIPKLEMLPLEMKRRWPELTGEQLQTLKEVVAECRNQMATAEIVLDDDASS